MSSWRNEYLDALQARDSQEQANKEVYDAYTKLADRTAALAKVPAPASAPLTPEPTKDTKAGRTPALPSDSPATLVRQNLLEAQRHRSSLETRLATLTSEYCSLQLASKLDKQRLGELASEKASLGMKLRDRDEELRGKSKLLEDVHDETLSLTIELNMAEAEVKKLRRENQELVDRWMARKGREADEMNAESKFS